MDSLIDGVLKRLAASALQHEPSDAQMSAMYFYRLDLPMDEADELDASSLDPLSLERIRFGWKIQKLWPEKPEEDHVHIFADYSPEPGIAKAVVMNPEDKHNLLPGDDAPVEGDKQPCDRPAEDWPDQAPSDLADIMKPQADFFPLHAKPKPRNYSCRPTGNYLTVPVTLAHHVFGQFVDDYKTYEPTAQDYRLVLELSNAMSEVYESEKSRASTFCDIMRTYEIDLTASVIQDPNITTDGDARVNGYVFAISAATVDFGNASRVDPYLESGLYHAAAIRHKAAKEPLNKFPCIHIYYAGPVLGFAGSVFTNGFNMNVLGPILPLFHHPADEDLRNLAAKMFGAYKKAFFALRDEYASLRAGGAGTLPDPLFPYVTEYAPLGTTKSQPRKFKYNKQISEQKLVFICEDLESSEKIIVKFTRRYSPEAHMACADLGFAPQLYGVNPIAGGWNVVVMEYLSPDRWKSRFQIMEERLLHKAKATIARFVESLHRVGYVHGDVRWTNILIHPSAEDVQVRLLDFDWAGKLGEAKYPMLVNPDLGGGKRRPVEAVGGMIISAAHDVAMVDVL